MAVWSTSLCTKVAAKQAPVRFCWLYVLLTALCSAECQGLCAVSCVQLGSKEGVNSSVSQLS